ncbi:MAG: hypothetical protein AB8B71_18195 [Paracoccaceae bacterium]
MSAPQVKGWCPSAIRPMMSGDGLVVRVKPALGHLSRAQVLGLCDLAHTSGSGLIDVTSRANLQLRGVREHSAALQGLYDLGLLDPNPDADAQIMCMTTPFWTTGDLSTRLIQNLRATLHQLPDLPAKMGIALDTGPGAVLQDVSADWRFELSASGRLILRADGAPRGFEVSEATAMDRLAEFIAWFCDTGGRAAGRMHRHLRITPLPPHFQTTPPRPQSDLPRPGDGTYAVPFGSTQAQDLADLMDQSQASGLRITPWRMIMLEDAKPCIHPAFISDPMP